MRLENKRAEDVTTTDIEALVANQDSEEQRLDFKRDPYGGSDSDRREMLRDIVAMANAGGGYIVIGIEEDDQCRAKAFWPVPNVAREVARMQDLAATGIAPRIIPLEIRSISMRTGDVILVRVPESPTAPHMVTLHNRTHFCWRHGTVKREMSIEEIRSAFAGDESQRRLSRIESLVTSINENYRAPLSIMTSTPIRLLSTAAEVRHAMDLRAKDELGDQPYYRATMTPTQLGSWTSFTDDVLDLVRTPVVTRRAGWHVWELSLRRSPDGVFGSNADGHEIILLGNGHMEFRHPLRHRSFQWRQSDAEAEKHPWLYPYPLVELPISFFRTARQVYGALAIDSSAEVTQSFLNIGGFILEPGHPAHAFFGMDGVEYTDEDYYGEATVDDAHRFDPDALVYTLMKDFYGAFGFQASAMPLFDENHHFQP